MFLFLHTLIWEDEEVEDPPTAPTEVDRPVDFKIEEEERKEI